MCSGTGGKDEVSWGKAPDWKLLDRVILKEKQHISGRVVKLCLSYCSVEETT